MTEGTLIVSEVFHSLQCEGRAIGIPAVFLRLGGCNLLCKSKTWVCDTIEVWSKSKATIFEHVIKPEWIENLRRGDHLVITGGEPMLHQKSIEVYLQWFNHKYKFMPFVEVETNGTIVPNWFLLRVVKFWNCSPKLSNSGEPAEKRISEPALECLNSYAQTKFKFVVENEGDVMEVMNEFGFLHKSKIMLMPAGGTREELDKVRLSVVEMCIKYGFQYSERLHIVIWNQKTGV